MPGAAFKDKVVAITGGASGIGLQAAIRLVEHGAKVSICDFNKEALEAAERDLKSKDGATVLATLVDIRDTKQVDDWIANTVKTLGGLDGAVNMAGVMRGSGPVSTISDDEWTWQMETNVTGLMKCLRAEMAAMERSERGGSIVNAGSISSVRGTGYYSAYCTTKHAVLGLTRCAAQEGASKKIRVNCICPALIDTPMVAAEDKRINMKMVMPNALDRRGTTDEVAKVIMFLLGDDSSFITGAMQDVTGGSYP